MSKVTLEFSDESALGRAAECVEGCLGIESPATTVPELVKIVHNTQGWLLRLAKQCDEHAERNRDNVSLANANQSEGNGYRAMAHNLEAVLAKTGKT